MSEQAKTVDDLITEWVGEASLGEGLLEAPVFWELVEKHAPHLHIIPGADAVVTEEGLEAAAKAIADSLGIAWTPENDVEKNTLRHEARAALEAAGITVKRGAGTDKEE
ncbi:hypothetical protein KAW64_12925 [bacterium]|nr:hypothetical protein [bacterium]